MPPGGTMLTLEAKVLGQRTPLIAARQVAIAVPSGEDGESGGVLRLRDLLAQVVRQEVGAFRERQEERRLLRVLRPEQIQQGAARGKIELGGLDESQAAQAAALSDEVAIAMALQAFADGLYYVFLDAQQQQDLDAEVRLRPDSTLTFIRLVALAGG